MNLKINDRFRVRDVKYFSGFSMNLKYDSVASTFSFGFYFDPENPEQKELACVSHFHEAQVQHNGETLITGYILSQSHTKSASRSLVQMSGYSKTGVLEDCSIPVGIYPLQSDGLSLTQIATKLLAPFELEFIVDPAVSDRMNKVYPSVTADESQSVKDFLCKLAVERNIIITHNEKGQLIFTEAKASGVPVAHFDGSAPATKITMNFNGQAIHSHITVMKEADKDGGNAGEFTIVNPYCPIVNRPVTISQGSGDDIDTETAAKRALAAELKNIPFTIELSQWDINSKIIRPNCLVSIIAPDLYIYKKTNLFVESVDYSGNNDHYTATLHCVLPEVYNGQYPKNIFVDVHKNSAG